MIKIKRASFEMASKHSEAKVNARSYAQTFSEHLIECVIFGRYVPAYNKRLNELLGYFRKAFGQKVKYGNKILPALKIEDAHECFYDLYMPEGFLLGLYNYAADINDEYTPCIEFEELNPGFWDRYREFEKRTYQKAAIEKNLTKAYLEGCIDFLRGKVA